MLFLSVGPNFVAIVGEEAKKYLAVDDRGKLFTAVRYIFCAGTTETVREGGGCATAPHFLCQKILMIQSIYFKHIYLLFFIPHTYAHTF